jgi:hypothetical protein
LAVTKKLSPGIVERYDRRLTKDYVSTLRSQPTAVILMHGIGVITGDAKASMKWKNYEADIVQLHLVYIVGWASDIPFANLSIGSSGKPTLMRLLKAWKDGTTHWYRLTQAEATLRQSKLTASYASGAKAMPVPRKERSDRGMTRKRAHSEQVDDSESEPDTAGSSKRRRRPAEE